MSVPFSILHDVDGDIDLSKGIQFTADLRTFTVQRLGERLSFFLGEWFLDLRLGIPYFTQVYGEKPDFALLDSLFRKAILGTAGVGTITILTLDFDDNTRTLSVAFECQLTDGSAITQADLAVPMIVDLSDNEAQQ